MGFLLALLKLQSRRLILPLVRVVVESSVVLESAHIVLIVIFRVFAII